MTDEERLFELLKGGFTPRDGGIYLGLPHKRVAAICHKWESKGIYEYGIAVDLGWLKEEEGVHVYGANTDGHFRQGERTKFQEENWGPQ